MVYNQSASSDFFKNRFTVAIGEPRYSQGTVALLVRQVRMFINQFYGYKRIKTKRHIQVIVTGYMCPWFFAWKCVCPNKRDDVWHVPSSASQRWSRLDLVTKISIRLLSTWRELYKLFLYSKQVLYTCKTPHSNYTSRILIVT